MNTGNGAAREIASIAQARNLLARPGGRRTPSLSDGRSPVRAGVIACAD